MKIKVLLFIQAIKYPFLADFNIEVSTTQRKTDENWVVLDVDQTQIELDIPDFTQADFVQAHIDQLENLKTKVKSDNQVKLNLLNDQVESLLALEFKDGM